MLSVLLLYFIEVYNRTQLRRVPLLRPTFAFINAIFYLLYVTIATLTLHLCGGPGGPTYTDFRRFVYFLLGCGHIGLVFGLLFYGLGLSCQLQRRNSASKGALGPPTRKVLVLVVLLSFTESVRTYNDLEYSLGGLPYNLGSGLCSVLFLAFVKLLLEWVPSMTILWAFRPIAQTSGVSSATLGGGHFLVDPLVPPGESVGKQVDAFLPL
mmetsp:Transcript_97834/g.314928  ORF Transcript_97834/g.314928 Transcript_97834/m.314928 type:complete len:210 (-) Transcript_97834:86-715(-)